MTLPQTIEPERCPECGSTHIWIADVYLPSERFFHSGPMARCSHCEATFYEWPVAEEEPEEDPEPEEAA